MGLEYERELLSTAGIEFQRVGALTLVSVDDAISFVGFCAENEIGLFGFDTFRVENGVVQPILKWCPDFSRFENIGPDFDADSRRIALVLLDEIKEEDQGDLFVEFVVAKLYR